MNWKIKVTLNSVVLLVLFGAQFARIIEWVITRLAQWVQRCFMDDLVAKVRWGGCQAGCGFIESWSSYIGSVDSDCGYLEVDWLRGYVIVFWVRSSVQP